MALQKIRIPDFGDVQKITVVEVFIKPGDRIEVEAALIALESEKAVMDIPSPFAGIIQEVLVQADAIVGSGDIIALIETSDVAVGKVAEPAEPPGEPVSPAIAASDAESVGPAVKISHATPSVRALAREKQVDLAAMAGTGPGGRILREDVYNVLSRREGQQHSDQGRAAATPPQPHLEDFNQFGLVEEIALSRIQKLSGPHLLTSWTSIPHVTHFDEADITELERFRNELNSSRQEGEVSFSILVFVIRAVAAALKTFPAFNSSLLPGGDKIALKKYYHLGIAVDTPDGLVVPVLRDADKKGFAEIAGELKRLSANARAGKSAIPDMQGATFTISSLGGIGGTGFTPIVNLPQVAILGLARSVMRPVWDGEQFAPRLILPFSVSYDHRVIDGASAARFCRKLCENIEDLKRTML
jgi:pyruvate dehydrogenase E2 component (dihydrolipoamide acetyltransferase)